MWAIWLTYTSHNVLDVLIHVFCSLHHMYVHTALHNLHPPKRDGAHSLHSRLCFREHCSQTVLPTPAFCHDASLHSCLPVLHGSCTFKLRHSAIILIFSAALQCPYPSYFPYICTSLQFCSVKLDLARPYPGWPHIPGASWEFGGLITEEHCRELEPQSTS
jgi:hypothetical protein